MAYLHLYPLLDSEITSISLLDKKITRSFPLRWFCLHHYPLCKFFWWKMLMSKGLYCNGVWCSFYRHWLMSIKYICRVCKQKWKPSSLFCIGLTFEFFAYTADSLVGELGLMGKGWLFKKYTVHWQINWAKLMFGEIDKPWSDWLKWCFVGGMWCDNNMNDLQRP